MILNAANYPATLVDLSYLNFRSEQACYYQFSPEQLTAFALEYNEGELTANGVLSVDTGAFKGRSPKDRFIVEDELTRDRVHWGDINIAFTETAFQALYQKMINYLSQRPFFLRDAYAGAETRSQLSLKVITETAYQQLFAYNLFIRPVGAVDALPQWTIIAAPGFKADPKVDGTRQANFSIINFSAKVILIGGTGYTGEIKKAVFSVLNFLLPLQGTLPMHCAANVGTNGDTAIFFGLSGTGKTTLSADPDRRLIGDDEHGWSKYGVFNFEGGCYAKTVNLSEQKEPQIYAAIKEGALLENICFYDDTRIVDYDNISKTENTRVSYPLHFIKNSVSRSTADAPKNIFFLTCDAFGVLPPVAKLDTQQALYYFLSGYTAKVAGTEQGVNEPQATFSACFGKAFLPLHPQVYASLLKNKLTQTNINIWLVNTGWVGGAYGTGGRIKLAYTRAIIKAALSGELNHANYGLLETFNLSIPTTCSGVPAQLLNPVTSWKNPADYWIKAKELKALFDANYRQLAIV
ncbi:MAG: phosphoenolpyruvate carboxykinase (ATP) [Mucilaginibacter sp.]|nr:phosphoenolpyruvate carboxykinase (ATP) [Mucilaginibacter sp.]